LMTNLQRYIFIELPRFSAQADQCISELEKWVFSMRNMHKLKDKPSNFNENSLTRLYDLSKFANFDTNEYQLYKNSLMFVSDYKNTIEYAKEEGREIGRAEGRAEGREIERMAIIKNMIASGMTAEQISELTQIPIEQIKQLFD
ncbi:MAG: PD-(D/E)XK nuclease family transposase, partial [Bacteroidales bacterium]|nr:PD-(D/E)XK nuclease family transposase [Bacteroidales bacterium]